MRSKKAVAATAEVGDRELAKFLSGMASALIAGGPEHGALAMALRKLASELKDREYESRPAAIKAGQGALTLSSENVSGLDRDAVERLLGQRKISKERLLDLAAQRFSMPQSQLRRLRTDDVKSAIRSALLHESSIEIIGEEASKSGQSRSS